MPKKSKKTEEEKQIERAAKIEEALIKVGIDIVKKGEGALFIISDNIQYKPLLKQKIHPFSIFEEGARKILISIATIDGAVIINREGIVVDYGAMIKSKKVFKGYGTRHAAAYSASLFPDTVAILASEENKKIRIFKKGKMVLQIDALEKNIKKSVSEASELLESVGFGTFSSLGVSTMAAAGLLPFGISILPGIILFGAPYYILKRIKRGKW